MTAGEFMRLQKGVLMRASTLVRIAAIFLCGATAFAQSSSMPADVDAKAAEEHFQPLRQSISLHNYPGGSFADGAKGFAVSPPSEPDVKLQKIPLPFANEADYKAYLSYCRADAIVLAKNLASSPVLMSSKSGIYTVSRFEVTQILKGDGLLSQDQNIVTYRVGGEVRDAGETLRIDMPGAPPYKRGKTYLLLLTRDKAASVLQYSTPDFGTLLLKGGRVYSNLGAWAGFLPGSSYSEVQTTFARVSQTACQ